MQQIYIYLLDEGTDVWRPVQALELDDGSFRIPSDAQVPDGETWEFNPGDTVRCEDRQLSDGKVALVACEKL